MPKHRSMKRRENSNSFAVRRATCTAYLESGGRRVEKCGAVPASPVARARSPAPEPPNKPPAPMRTVQLSWKDNSRDETGFRVYRIVENQKTRIAELGPNTTTYDKSAPPKACTDSKRRSADVAERVEIDTDVKRHAEHNQS